MLMCSTSALKNSTSFEEEKYQSIMNEVLHPILAEGSGLELYITLEAAIKIGENFRPEEEFLKTVMRHLASEDPPIQACFFINLNHFIDI